MEQRRIAVIGGVNMDIGGFSFSELNEKDSNIGKIELSFGGVGRNVAENLKRMGENVSMMTAFGNDMFGREIKENLIKLGIDVSLSETFNAATSTYLYIADEDKDMRLAVNDMSIYDLLTVDKIKNAEEKLNAFDVIVLDTNLREDVLAYVLKNLTPPKAVDPVSTIKAAKIKNLLPYIDVLKPNALEAEYLTGVKITDEKTAYNALDKLIEQGVKRAFISLGKSGAVARGLTTSTKVTPIKTEVLNSTGAGDAFMAGLVREFLISCRTRNMAISGVTAASIALESEDTVSRVMSKELLKDRIKIKETEYERTK